MNYRRIVGLVWTAAIFSGCAGVGQRLDEKVSQEPAVMTRADVHRDVTQWINESKDLSSDQKPRLLSLRDSIVSQEDALRGKSLKLRSVLVKNVLSADYNPDEVSILQDRIRSVEVDRLETFFWAVQQANAILGRWSAENERASEDFYTQMMLEMDLSNEFH